MSNVSKNVAIIVAHPDDETLWAGGTILSHPEWKCFIACLCRKSDTDRAPKFEKVLKVLGAKGKMGDMDDGPEQTPLPDDLVETSILELLPRQQFDLVITHSIYGEYTTHHRHEEIGRAVIRLWHSGKLGTKELWVFAFEDGGRTHYPQVIKEAPLDFTLTIPVWDKVYDIITNIYGFNTDSWEARSTPKEEAFWQFKNARKAYQWLAEAK